LADGSKILGRPAERLHIETASTAENAVNAEQSGTLYFITHAKQRELVLLGGHGVLGGSRCSVMQFDALGA
jgi:hypothetical protein